MIKRITYIFVLTLIIGCNYNEEINLSVMTYNVRYGLADDGENSWQHRKQNLTNLINSKQPDFLGTQEGLPFQVDFITKALPNHKFIGKDRDNNGKGENTAIFYNITKFKLIKHNTHWLADDQNKVSKLLDAAFPRIYTYGLFEELKTGKQFWVINTHFDHIGIKAREKSAEIITKKIKEINPKNNPLIFMGDLNATPKSEVINILKSTLNTTNENPKSSWTFNDFVFDNPIKKRIDYIFISNNIKVNNYEILTKSINSRYPSDHFPVYVELTF